jgi:probable rRNA maturation factor
MSVLVENLQKSVEVDTKQLRELAERALAEEKADPASEVSLALIDRETMRSLNQRYRGIDAPTDVLSFPMSDEKSFVPPVRLLGDVLVCPEVAAENATKLGHSLDEELSLLVVHGVLHLLGYSDESDEERKAMDARQKELLVTLGKAGRD